MGWCEIKQVYISRMHYIFTLIHTVWPPSLPTLHLQGPKKNTRLNHLHVNWFIPEGHNGVIRPSVVTRDGKKKRKQRPGVTLKDLCPFSVRFSLITQTGRKPKSLTLRVWCILQGVIFTIPLISSGFIHSGSLTIENIGMFSHPRFWGCFLFTADKKPLASKKSGGR